MVDDFVKTSTQSVTTVARMQEMKDVQSQPDHRKIDINRVGIKGIKYPINVLDRANKVQATVASVNMYVHLPHEFKGTHMSRFVEVLNEYCGNLNLKAFFEMLEAVKTTLDARSANLEISFPYFVSKKAPVSGVASLMEYTCEYKGEIDGDERKLLVCVTVPVCTLCPCSKEISSQGAHNQRGLVSVTLFFTEFFWIEEVIEIVEVMVGEMLMPLTVHLRKEESLRSPAGYFLQHLLEGSSGAAGVGAEDDLLPVFTMVETSIE